MKVLILPTTIMIVAILALCFIENTAPAVQQTLREEIDSNGDEHRERIVGSKIHLVKIGMTRHQVHSILGQPDVAYKEGKMSERCDCYYYRNHQTMDEVRYGLIEYTQDPAPPVVIAIDAPYTRPFE